MRAIGEAFEKSPLGVVIASIHGTIEYANEGFVHLTGYSVDELLGVHISSLSQEEPAGEQWFQENLAPGFAWQRDFQSKTKSGEDYWVQLFWTPLRNAGATVTHLVGIVEDITERKRLEQALREDVERFRGLCQASIEAIAIHDKGTILDANPALGAMFGYELAELVGMHVLKLTAPESRDLVSQRIVSNDDRPFEARGLRKDGATVLVEICAKAFRYRGRSVRVACVRDIGERTRTTERIKALEESRLARSTGHPQRRGERRAALGTLGGGDGRTGPLRVSRREVEVLQLLAQGLTNGQIAARLSVSQRTIDHHVSHILTKLDAKNRTEAVVSGGRAGLLQLDSPELLGRPA